MQQLYYIRLLNCPQGNITWRKPNITAKQYNSPKANITEKNGNRITITVLFFAETVGSKSISYGLAFNVLSHITYCSSNNPCKAYVSCAQTDR